MIAIVILLASWEGGVVISTFLAAVDTRASAQLHMESALVCLYTPYENKINLQNL